MCVFQCNFNVGIDSFQIDLILKFPNQNLYAPKLYFVSATWFKQHFPLHLITRNKFEQ